MEAGLEELTEVPDVGEITALSLLDWFAQPQSQHLIRRLKEAGVNFQSTRQQSRMTGLQVRPLSSLVHSPVYPGGGYRAD